MLTLGFFPSLFFFVFFLDPGMEPLFSPPLRSWYLLSFFSRPLPQSRQACLRTCVRACGWFKAVELEDSFNASVQDRPTDQPPASPQEQTIRNIVLLIAAKSQTAFFPPLLSSQKGGDCRLFFSSPLHVLDRWYLWLLFFCFRFTKKESCLLLPFISLFFDIYCFPLSLLLLVY